LQTYPVPKISCDSFPTASALLLPRQDLLVVSRSAGILVRAYFPPDFSLCDCYPQPEVTSSPGGVCVCPRPSLRARGRLIFHGVFLESSNGFARDSKMGPPPNFATVALKRLSQIVMYVPAFFCLYFFGTGGRPSTGARSCLLEYRPRPRTPLLRVDLFVL